MGVQKNFQHFMIVSLTKVKFAFQSQKIAVFLESLF